jgi:DNA polymerase (family 10)
MTAADVAAALDEFGTLLALTGKSDFRAKAYANAARAAEQFPGDLIAEARAGRLTRHRGFGEAMAEKVTEFAATGRIADLDAIRESIPPGVRDLLRVNGLGPKKVKALWDAGLADLAAVRAGCEAGAVARIKGFGDKTQQRILAAVTYLGRTSDRVRLDKATVLAAAIVERLAERGIVATVAGEVRRGCETVGSLELVAAGDPFEAFALLPGMQPGGWFEHPVNGKPVRLPARLTCAPPEQFGAALVELTGSGAHLTILRERGALAGADEPAVYDALGLNWVPPELREGLDEVPLAAAGELPELLEAGDIRGVFHNHTTASDGQHTLAEMATAAAALGFEYFGVGDHSQSLLVANGLTPDRVRRQWAEIDAWNAANPGVRVLKGTECDILPDGTLDYDDELLAGFEYVVASVHTHFGLSEADQTARVCKALAHPRVTMLGHPSGRLLLRREAYRIDLDRVVRCAAEHGKMIEINAQPNRLDLNWEACRLAKALGVPLVINPDAHDTAGLGLVPWGVTVARRAGLTAADVFNTRPLSAVLRELARRRG